MAGPEGITKTKVKRMRRCSDCDGEYNVQRGKQAHKNICQDKKDSCPVCTGTYRSGKMGDHRCSGPPVKTPPSLEPFLDIKYYDWRFQCPFDLDVVDLSNASPERLQLWDRTPSVFPATSPITEYEAFGAVVNSITKNTNFQIYEKGIRVNRPDKDHRKAALDLLYESIARRSTTSKTSRDAISYVTNIWTDDIQIEVPDFLSTSRYVLGDKTPVGVNITPKGAFVGAHIDINREAISLCIGCTKVWLTFPATTKNFTAFTSTVGLPGRLARIGKNFEGGLVFVTKPGQMIHLPGGVIHATITTEGGLLLGINFSTAESLPTMVRSICSQLPYYKHANDHIHEDFEVYVNALKLSLDMDVNHTLLVDIVNSWHELLQAIDDHGLSQSFAAIISKVKRSLRKHYENDCPCDPQQRHKIKTHLPKS